MPNHRNRTLHDRVVALMRDAVRDSRAGRMDLVEFLDGLPDCLGWTGADQCYRFVNRAYAAWHGLPRDQIMGRKVEDMVGPEAYALLRPHMERALAGERVRATLTLAIRGAPARDIVMTLVPRIDAHGNTDGYLTLVEDVTAAKRAG